VQRRLFFKFCPVVLKTLDRIHAVLHLGQLTHGKLNHLHNTKDVTENETADRWGHTETGCDDENADGKDEQIPNEVQPGRQPTLIRKGEVIGCVHVVDG
jgi:hypothetical protein